VLWKRSPVPACESIAFLVLPKFISCFLLYSMSSPDFRVRRVKAESIIEPQKRAFSILMVVQILSSFNYIALLVTRK